MNEPPDPPDPADPQTWLVFCRMTAVGGSERGTCPCVHPEQCEYRDHPDYPHQRAEAQKRLWAYFRWRSKQEGPALHPLIEKAIDQLVGPKKPDN